MTHRSFRHLFLPALCLLLFAPTHAWAAIYSVTDLNDSLKDTGSIRYAVNNAQNGDTITFAPGLSGIIPLSSKLVIANSVTLSGPGAGQIALSGGYANSVFEISAGTAADPVTISGLTIENGYSSDGGGVVMDTGTALTLTGCTLTGNSTDFDGGGVYNDQGTLTITNCVFTANSAGFDGGCVNNSYGTATLTNCVFTDNAGDDGGCVYDDNGTETLTACVFTGNTASDDGCGLYTSRGTDTLTDCVFTGNTAYDGGGLYNDYGTDTLTDCVFTGNNTSDEAGGVYNDFGTNTLTNCTLTGNSASYEGGGVYNDFGTDTLTNCTLTGNSAPVGEGGGLYNDDGTDTLANDILYGDIGGEISTYQGTTAAYCDIGEALGSGGDGVTDGGNNFNNNPGFVRNPGANGAGDPGDLHLRTSPTASPCFQAGATQAEAPGGVTIPSADITGVTRPSPPSIGAYETVEVAAGTPTANSQIVSATVDTAKTIILTGTDPDTPPLTLTYAGTQPAHGTLTGTAPILTYTPSPGYSGPDSFTFTASNGTHTSSPATVRITVSPAAPPIANSETIPVTFGTASGVYLSGMDPQGEALTSTVATQPAHGKLTGTAPSLTYTPNAGFHGADSFTFTVKNTSGLTSAPATITLNVAVGTPTANPQSVSATENTAASITLSGSDPDTRPGR